MAPEFIEDNNSLQDAVVGIRAFKHNDIVNRANNSKLLSTKMDIALYHDEDAADGNESFYKLQKSKRVSTANLKSLIKRQANSGSEDFMCSPVQDKFTTNLDILEELSEPDTSRSECPTRPPSIARSRRTPRRATRPDLPVPPTTRSLPNPSVTHRIPQSQDYINHLLAELDRPTKRSLPHAQFTTNIVSRLRPHFASMNHIASHLEPPTDKWSAFIHYVAWLGVDSSLKEAHRARAGAIAQLGYALDRWQPHAAGPRRWITRMQQACNVWQDTLHELQFCSFRDVNGETLRGKDREELSRVVGMEGSARALCVHAKRFGDKWEGNRRKYIGGGEDGEGGGKREGERGELDNIREQQSHDSFASARSHLGSGGDDTGRVPVYDPEIISKALVEHELTEENLRALTRRYYSMPDLNPVGDWVAEIPRRSPKLRKAFEGKPETLGDIRGDTPLSRKMDGPSSQAVFSLVEEPSSNLSKSTIPQIMTNPSLATHSCSELKPFPSESPSTPQICKRSSRMTFRAGTKDLSAVRDALIPIVPTEQLSQIASRPLTVRGAGSPTDFGQNWQKAGSEDNSLNASGKAKQMWKHVKKYIKQHHESANATVAVHYGQGPVALEPDKDLGQVNEIEEQGQDHIARQSQGLGDVLSATEFSIGLIRPRPPRLRHPSTAFSDLESYRSSLSESSDSINEYGPVALPPRVLSTPNLFAELNTDSSFIVESSSEAQEPSVTGAQYRQGRHYQTSLAQPVTDNTSILQNSYKIPIVDKGDTKWTAPSGWNRSTSPSSPSPIGSINDEQVEHERDDGVWLHIPERDRKARRLVARREEERKLKRKEDKKQRDLKYAELMERRLVAHGILAKK
ncbi:hypothetical protein SLS60_003769 [Paraconiothyrium brasiliense]|uniref:Uncharacterized protein n=1 Tax=Paraconiothyrium brasiliense TaxID=300254 RepID=A0ABR3RPS6_9PLEO